MKTTILFCFAILISQTAISQKATLASNTSTTPLSNWQPVNNLSQTFRAIFGEEASLHWINELAKEGSFYQPTHSNGLIVVLPDYMYSKARLEAKLEAGFFKVKNTKLLPLADTRTSQGNQTYARFLGTLEGMPASMDMVVVKRGDKYLTIMGFCPGNELNTEFSNQFQHDIARLFSPALAGTR
ncbi:MAG: hypothetical protein GC192_01045 [Bacteroidetes bacterium]|nr:hypothetical protein [Bacteroidota bacterium]